jgi:hypothetical protein
MSESDRRVTRCDTVRIMDWDQLIEYLGGVLGGAMGRDAIQAEDRRNKHVIDIIISYIFIPPPSETFDYESMRLLLSNSRVMG